MNRSTGPTVSIIIPTYNSEHTINRCLKSVTAQTYPFCETLVIDNFSEDDTLKIAKGFRVRTILRKSNPALAKNVGLANSTAVYVLFLDSDQILSKQLVKDCVEKCQRQKADMVIIPEVFIGRHFWGSCSAVWKNCYQTVEHSRTSRRIVGEPRFFRREKLNFIGMFDPGLLWGEDHDLYQRLEETGAKETVSDCRIYHFEPDSIKSAVMKNLRYGESVPMFLKQTGENMSLQLFRRALLTMGRVVRSYAAYPSVICGCAFLLMLKTCSVAISFVVGMSGLSGASR